MSSATLATSLCSSSVLLAEVPHLGQIEPRIDVRLHAAAASVHLGASPAVGPTLEFRGVRSLRELNAGSVVEGDAGAALIEMVGSAWIDGGAITT